jgi:hypothetical protein
VKINGHAFLSTLILSGIVYVPGHAEESHQPCNASSRFEAVTGEPSAERHLEDSIRDLLEDIATGE